MVPEEVGKILFKQGYRIVGKHSGVKICHWTKESLVNNRVCYKEKWYGIRSHKCMEFSPSLIWCTHKCLWCWRIQSGDRKNLVWKEFPFPEKIDEPREILEKAIEMRRLLLTGFKGNPKVDVKKWEEANIPTNVAISLSGEPTLYPKLSELIEESHKLKMKTFLVTNGTLPERLEKLDNLPWQLYVTLPAPSKEIYLKACRPKLKDGWERIMRTLEILPSLKTRKVIRLTMVKNLNMSFPEKYAKLIEKAEPNFVEVKAYEWVGESQKRLPRKGMPFLEDILNFAKEIEKNIGYKVKDAFKPSGVALLVKD